MQFMMHIIVGLNKEIVFSSSLIKEMGREKKINSEIDLKRKLILFVYQKALIQTFYTSFLTTQKLF